MNVADFMVDSDKTESHAVTLNGVIFFCSS